MKKTLLLSFILFLGFSAATYAQNTVEKTTHGIKKGTKKGWQGTKKGANKAWHATKKGAKHVGNETAEISSKGKAHLVDKKSDRWIGAEGQTIFINDGSYYWINGNGKRIYVSEAALKARNK